MQEVSERELFESDLSRLHLLGLVEQRGMAMGLTATGIQAIARLRLG
jgi:hypothetical protein